MAAAHACQLNSLDDVLASIVVFRDDTGIIGAKLHCSFSSVCDRQSRDDLAQLDVGGIILPFHARKGKESWFNANKLMKKECTKDTTLTNHFLVKFPIVII